MKVDLCYKTEILHFLLAQICITVLVDAKHIVSAIVFAFSANSNDSDHSSFLSW